jgi:hypothetical protein
MNDELLIAVRNLIQAADAYLVGYDEPSDLRAKIDAASLAANKEPK